MSSAVALPRWQKLFLLAAGLMLTAAFGLLLAAGLASGLAIRRGLVRVPAVDVRVGRLHVMSFVSDNPNCHPLLLPNCGTATLTRQFSPRRRQYYMLWAVAVRETRQPGGGVIWDQVGGGRVLQWPVGP